MDIATVTRDTNVLGCMECGKCTSNCPIARFDRNFSPRYTLSTFIEEDPENFLKDSRLWKCLTCGMCNVRCPADVKYTEFTKRLRIEASANGAMPDCTHGGALQSLMKIMTSPTIKQDRLDWVPKELKIAEAGEYLYFVGCLPYFDAFFTELEMDTLSTAKGVIKILNHAGIEPVLLKNERCCGHDLLWSGDAKNFKKLAKHNVKAIRESGAKKVIFSCAEGYRTFKLDYPNEVGDLGFEVQHISEFIFERIEYDFAILKDMAKTVTYHDACRLGRHLGVFDPPRDILKNIPNLEIKEMVKHRETAMCCGTSAWMSCDRHSKAIQTERLRSARKTGADLMITSCPKCKIHFTCAMKDDNFPEESRIEIKDLATVVAEVL